MSKFLDRVSMFLDRVSQFLVRVSYYFKMMDKFWFISEFCILLIASVGTSVVINLYILHPRY